jgi:SAM-dependent methyltransferase
LAAVKRVLLRALTRLGLLPRAYRAYEEAKAFGRRSAGTGPDGLPVPPPKLIVRVAGTADVEWFLEGGRRAAGSIRMALLRHGRQVDELEAMLDFGCGCGRVLRNWHALGKTAVHGSDRDERAIAWCRDNLRFAAVETNGLEPPLAHRDGAFDLVYALSVLTHLTEELQLAWLAELRRVLRPDALLLLTTHGAAYEPRLEADERERFRAGELVVRRPEAVGTNLCTSFHPEAYVRSRLTDGFDVLEFVAEGAKGNPDQDLYLLRKE